MTSCLYDKVVLISARSLDFNQASKHDGNDKPQRMRIRVADQLIIHWLVDGGRCRSTMMWNQ